MNPFQAASFLLAAHELKQLPEDAGSEIVFAGRSNAGKSSALNALAGARKLARISRTPGRTQQLVVFTLDESRRLVDLPGYGYAKVPVELRQHWQPLIEAYLRQRRSLRALVLIMDIRHPLREYDRQLLGFCASLGLPCHCLLTKADKLSRGAASSTLQAVERELRDAGWPASAQLFSALKGTGVDSARERLAALLAPATGEA
ncbi:MAG TPA: ribosome biogenesis GTP-binding protein YihA/YsxC [Rhodanobacteraceae bacterium]|nr:ribosome biogenesis GTP-binding protein YihA/YsxC [Rhodanobacteraceae bacterium]